MHKIDHSIICSVHGPLLNLEEHIHNIAKFFVYQDVDSSQDLIDWFQNAAGIRKVEYFGQSFDESYLWCRPAWEYEEEKSKYQEKLIKKLTIFNYIWGGFECLINSLKIKDCPNNSGKITAISFYLQSNFDNVFQLVKYYTDILNYLKELIVLNPWHGEPAKLFKKKKCTGPAAEGLSIVYQIRNKFAHGAFIFSEPAEFNITKPYDLQIISASSRIILMTIQMLLIAVYKSRNIVINEFFFGEEEYGDEESNISCQEYLNKLHLKKDNRKN